MGNGQGSSHCVQVNYYSSSCSLCLGCRRGMLSDTSEGSSCRYRPPGSLTSDYTHEGKKLESRNSTSLRRGRKTDSDTRDKVIGKKTRDSRRLVITRRETEVRTKKEGRVDSTTRPRTRQTRWRKHTDEKNGQNKERPE